MAETDFVRAHKGWLQTAFLLLRKEQREIALLATVDVAPEDYFKRIADQIKRREKRGFAIVYDYSTAPDQLDASHRAAVDALRPHGFVYLRDTIPVEDYWISTVAVEGQVAADSKANDQSDETAHSETSDAAEAAATSLRSGQLPNPMHDISPSRSSENVEEQVTRSVQVIKQQAEHYHVYAFLGANRLSAVVEGLSAEGFTLKDTHWMDVMAVEHGRAEAQPTIDHRRP